MHISGIFKEAEKPDIEAAEPDIDVIKPDIEKNFRPKTAGNIIKLFETFRDQKIFGRSDIMEVLDIKPSGASEMLKEMAGCGVIEAVSGYWKGKYRFRRR